MRNAIAAALLLATGCVQAPATVEDAEREVSHLERELAQQQREGAQDKRFTRTYTWDRVDILTILDAETGAEYILYDSGLEWRVLGTRQTRPQQPQTEPRHE